MALRVIVRAGPDVGHGVGLRRDEALSVGRGEGEGLKLGDLAVSRHHLSLQLSDDERVRVIEVAGVNPVWTVLNGERRTLSGGELLDPSAALTVGNTTLGFEPDLGGVAGSLDGAAARGGVDPSGRPEATAGSTSADGRGTIEMDVRQTGRTRLAALAALGDRLARCGSLQAVYRTASEWAIEALPVARALLLSSDGTDILAAATSGPVVDLAISRTLLHRVLSEHRAVLVRDVLAEPELADRRSVQVRGILGAMAAPARNLIFYAEWGAKEAVQNRGDDSALTLLVCAAQLLDALGDSANERSQMRAALAQRGSAEPGRIVGGSAAIKRLHVFLERVAATNATVLVNGESGTGKELAARMIHALSPRASRPFIAINCAAVPENLLESEFFGHEKGAFTGAVSRHEGVFERAHTGTLFLDEIAEMAPATQARMLRVLESRSFTRVGGTEEVNVDVRLIAATHRDLRQRVTEGRFREDLLYRLSVIQTRLPPLRERRDDIPELVRHFCEVLGDDMGRHVDRIAADALQVLCNYRWPGNVRELRNVVERALVLGDGPELELDDLPPELKLAGPPTGAVVGEAPSVGIGATVGTILPLAELETQAIAAALVATGGNKARAAALLGIDRTTLYRKLKDQSS
ncbi:Response regulator of zinc sigma-54-dependent two-component system [Enhygromyxa salina]|uniref:Response regulator of zinc sigma-54-dependent two-component system n=1 Tax=Enhygromyxa salina TaxID=215803 RepID=A0A0C1ZUC6_9BACT|nr:sigma 54-dependent Fis family transcriptional regulator [Enhygromyxa salina]KIG14658.1 Response regulator of zinc sigma-54-dependent two-component system [Enhygromyxa salina]